MGSSVAETKTMPTDARAGNNIASRAHEQRRSEGRDARGAFRFGARLRAQRPFHVCTSAITLLSTLLLAGGCDSREQGVGAGGGGGGQSGQGGAGGAAGTGGATPPGPTDTEDACVEQCAGYAASCPSDTNTSVCVPLCTLGASFRAYSECEPERTALDRCQAQPVVPTASCGCTTAGCLTAACLAEWQAVYACIRALPPDCAKVIRTTQQGICEIDVQCRNLTNYQVSCTFVGDASWVDCTCADNQSGPPIRKVIQRYDATVCDRAAAECGFPH